MTDHPSLLCAGNLTVDETTDPDGRRIESLGGDALFAALAARWAGGRPTILAPLGTDATPASLAAVRTAGTEPQTLPRRHLPTVRNVIGAGPHGTRTWQLVHGREHFEAMSPRPGDLTPEALGSDGILLSGMAIDAQLTLAHWLIGRTRATLFFDPQEDYLAGREDELRAAVAACDVFLPSEVEAVALGHPDPYRAAEVFLGLGPRTVVIKLGAAGCLVATHEHPEPTVLAAAPVDVVDGTGAGDAFCGAFAVAYLRAADPYAAAGTGMAAARHALGGWGVHGLVDAVSTAAS